MHTKFAKYRDEKLANNYNLALIVTTVLNARRKIYFFYVVSLHGFNVQSKVKSIIEEMKSYFRVYEGIARRGVSYAS